MTPKDLVKRARELGSTCHEALEKAESFSTIEEMLAKMSHGEWLCFFSRCGELAYVRVLIAVGVDVNAKNNHGNTALMVAAWWGHFTCADLLKKAGAK